MSKQINIAIQARSTSTRLPGKSSFDLGDSTVIENVIRRCLNSKRWLNEKSGLSINCDVWLLIPEGDVLSSLRGDFKILEGSEPDVLSRYTELAGKTYADYICRITGDCPLIPEFVISSVIKSAVLGSNDYTSNTIPRFRTAIDGHDCEVLSNRMLKWLGDNAINDFDKEHVTTLLYESPPKWARIHPIIGYYDLSDIKLSVDTPEDMDKIRRQFYSVNSKIKAARQAGYTVGRL